MRRVPKRGFTNIFGADGGRVNVGDLEELFEAGATVTPEALKEAGIVKRRFDVLKVLGDGELTKKLAVSAHRFSASAKEKIEKAGGSATVAARPDDRGREEAGQEGQEAAAAK